MPNPVSECVLVINQLYCPSNLCLIVANFCPPGQSCSATKSKLGFLIECHTQTTTPPTPISPDTFQSMIYSIILLSSVLAILLSLAGVLYFCGYISCHRRRTSDHWETRHLHSTMGTYRTYDSLDHPAQIWSPYSRERFQPVQLNTFNSHFSVESGQRFPSPTTSMVNIPLDSPEE